MGLPGSIPNLSSTDCLVLILVDVFLAQSVDHLVVELQCDEMVRKLRWFREVQTVKISTEPPSELVDVRRLTSDRADVVTPIPVAIGSESAVCRVLHDDEDARDLRLAVELRETCKRRIDFVADVGAVRSIKLPAQWDITRAGTSGVLRAVTETASRTHMAKLPERSR